MFNTIFDKAAGGQASVLISAVTNMSHSRRTNEYYTNVAMNAEADLVAVQRVACSAAQLRLPGRRFSAWLEN